MQYLVGDIKQGVAGFQSVHVYRNKQPRFSCKHAEVTQGLEMIPEESKNPPRTNTFVWIADHSPWKKPAKKTQSGPRCNHIKTILSTNTIIFLIMNIAIALNSAEQREKGDCSVFTYYRCYEQGSEDKEHKEGQQWRSWRCWVCTCEQSRTMLYCSTQPLFNKWSELCFKSNLSPLNGFQLKITAAPMNVLEQFQEGKEALVVR